MLILHVEGKDYNELLANALKELHITFTPKETEAPEDELAKERKKKSKKDAVIPAATPAAPASLPPAAPAVPPAAAAVAPVPAAPAPTPTAPAALPLDVVRAALHTVTIKMQGDESDAAGLKRAQAVLEKFGAKKISAVHPDQYSALIAHCAEVVKGLGPA